MLLSLTSIFLRPGLVKERCRRLSTPQPNLPILDDSLTFPTFRDSNWEMDNFDNSDDNADFTPDEASESDVEWEELDYMSAHNMSINSNADLTTQKILD